MKTKVKRLSKRTLAVFLGVLMLVSSIGFGTLITANAATTYNLMGFDGDWSTGISLYQTGTNTYGIIKYANANQEYKVKSSTGTWYPSGNNKKISNTGYYNFSIKPSNDPVHTSLATDFYVVAGTENLCGSGWAIDNPANLMTKSGSKYSITYSSVAAGDYEFKLAKNCSWDNAVGYSNKVTFSGVSNNGSSVGNNIKFSLAEAASVTIAYDTSTGAVTVSVPETTYSVTVEAGTGGKIKVGSAAASSSQTATAGSTTTAVVTAVPDTGYHFTGWTKSASISYASGSASSETVTINATAAGTLTAAFEKSSYTLSKKATTNGSFTLSPGEGDVVYGTKVTVTPNANEGYEVDTVKYGNTEITPSNDEYSFNMPASNTEVSVTFKEKKYNVTVVVGTGGKFNDNTTANKTVSAGSINAVTLPTVKADTGYTFTGWTKTTNASNLTLASASSASAATVKATGTGTVTANFTKNKHTVTYTSVSGQYTFSDVKYGTTAITSGTTEVDYGETVSFKLAGVTNGGTRYFPKSVTVTGASNVTYNSSTGDGSFTMPDANVTITPSVTKQYKITIADLPTGINSITVKQTNSSGSNIASETFVDENSKVYVKATPKSGYRVGTYTPTLSSSTFTVTKAQTISVTAVKTYNAKWTKAGEGTAGTVKINGTTRSSGTNLAVDSGNAVTFVAADGTNSKFAGWYSDSACTTLLSTEKTYKHTNSISADVSIYAAFVSGEYYLAGQLNLVDYGDMGTINCNNGASSYKFEQSASNPALFTYTVDVKKDQYPVISTNNGYGYNTPAQNGVNGQVAYGLVDLDNNGKVEATNKWKVDIGEAYKTVTYTWNAVAKTLSWQIAEVNMNNYTAVYIDNSKNNSYNKMYIYLDNNAYGPIFPGYFIPDLPYVEANGNNYNLLLIKNWNNDNKAGYVISTGSEQKEEANAFESGGTYSITVNQNGTITKDDTFSPASYNVTVNTTTNGHGTNATASPTTTGKGATVTVTTNQSNSTDYAAIVTATDANTNEVAVTKTNNTTFTFTMPAANVTVNVTYVPRNKHTVSLRTNDSELGKIAITAPSGDIYSGDEVSFTLNAASKAMYKDGTLKISYGENSTITPTLSGDTYSFTMPDDDVAIYAQFEEYVGDADFWYDGYQRKSENEAGTVVLQDGSNATGVQDDLDNLRFNEATYNGNMYAYLKVTRKDTDPKTLENYQEFVVKSSLDADGFGNGGSSSGGSGNFYVEIKNASGYWDNNVKARMYKNNNWTSYNGMSTASVTNSTTGAKYWKVYIDSGVTKIQITSNDGHYTTGEWTLSQGGGISIPDGATSMTAYDSGNSDQYGKSSGSGNSGSSSSNTNYLWSMAGGTDSKTGKAYTYIDGTANGNDAYSAIHLGAFGTNYAMHSRESSYYVVILYPDTDYGKLYDDKASVGSNAGYRVFATHRLPGEDDPTVNYWAKDGVVRMWNKSTATFGTTTVTATDYVTAGTSHNFNVASNSVDGNGAWQANEKWLEGTATKGQSITVTTQLTDDAKSKYYVKGYSFNGETPEIYTYKSNGTYSCTYTIPSDFKGNKLEITPIYFLKDDTNTVTFYIDGFNDTVQKAWGNTLYVYPFYQYYVNGSGGTVTPSGGQASNFLAYPGQPVINYGGRRYTQIPLTDDATANGYRVKGVTINNGYWDQVHGNTYGNGDGAAGTDANDHNMGVDFVNVHRQTYDYDDFYKIYNENGKNGEKNLNSIYFTFKYQTDHQHRGTYADDKNTTVDQNSDNAVALTSSNVSNHNWEVLTNNFKKPIDLFGTKLSDADLTTYKDKEMYVISEGYEANNAGKFATEWAIYKRDGNTYTKVTVPGGKTSIVPSVLAITSADRINSTEYPALDGDLATTDYKAIYQALESYRGVPVKICYEKELHGGSKSGGYDPAYRSDGRWTFTRTTDYIKANVKIEYMNEKLGINSYTEDPFVDDSHIGTNTGVSAYFTYNSAESGYTAAMDGKTSISNVAIQDDKFFNFKAETAGSYEFVGWYSVDTNGDYHQVNNDDVAKVTGHSTMSTDSTFVARFKYVANGSLTISHTLASGNAGRGDTYLGVYVNDAQIADETTNTDSVKLDKTYIGSNKTTNTIKVVLRTVANGENTFNKFTAKKTDDNDAITDATGSLFGGNNVTSDKVTTRTFEFTVNDLFTNATQNVLALSYYSALNKPINRYVITYNFQERYGTEKAYTVKGEFTDAELSSYVEGTAQNKSFKNTATEFFSDKAPHESNFQKTLTWTLDSIDDVTKDSTWKQTTEGGVDVYTVNASVNSTQVQNIDRIGIFDVPYDTNGKDSNYTAKKVNDSVDMLASDAHKTFEIATKYGKWFENIDVTNFDKNYVNNDESEKLITAPEVINDGNIPMYFSYWKVSTLTKNSKAGKYITKCFYPRFNYVAYENYYIEAVYSSDSSQAYSNLVADKNLMDASISFLQDSRNQWNDKNSGATDDAEKARDKIYNDFALSFKYQGKKLTDYKGNGTNDVRLGMVIQKLGQVDMSDGDHIGTLDSYEKKYESSVAGTATKLQTALPNSKWTNGVWANVTDASTNNKYASYNHVIAANNENITGVSDFNTELIDNKNRTEYSFFLDNSQGQTADLTAKNKYSNKNYVYRAFSYIMVKVDGTWTVKVSETPAYFCMYDIATSTK